MPNQRLHFTTSVKIAQHNGFSPRQLEEITGTLQRSCKTIQQELKSKTLFVNEVLTIWHRIDHLADWSPLALRTFGVANQKWRRIDNNLENNPVCQKTTVNFAWLYMSGFRGVGFIKALAIHPKNGLAVSITPYPFPLFYCFHSNGLDNSVSTHW